jgi:hypothetical protein
MSGKVLKFARGWADIGNVRSTNRVVDSFLRQDVWACKSKAQPDQFLSRRAWSGCAFFAFTRGGASRQSLG